MAVITNMAVTPPARRRGVATTLMRAACGAAVREMKPRPQATALYVYKDNETARR